MRQPEGFTVDGLEHKVCLLKKSLYGLKQAPRQWNSTLDTFMKSLHFTRLEKDHAIYVSTSHSVKCIISVYVDDLIIACSSTAFLIALKSKLCVRFEMSDLGNLCFYLGVQIIRNRSAGTLFIHQEQYVIKLLTKMKMLDCKPCQTPQVDLHSKVKPSDSPQTDVSNFPYRTAIGSLLYLSLTSRPDIAVAANYCSRFQENPKAEHIQAVKRILRYLQGTKKYGIRFKSNGTGVLNLLGYSDADYAGDRLDRKSTSGFAFILCGALVSWKTQKQVCTAVSSCEAEYYALKYAVMEAVWLRQILTELGFPQQKPTIMYEDNQGCIALAKNPTNHQRSKHIDVAFHFSREKVQDHTIQIVYCATQYMLADFFTKPLRATIFERLRSALGMCLDSGEVLDSVNCIT